MAISSSQRSGIRGLSKLRRTLRRIEPEATEGLRRALREGAEAIKTDAQALAPRDEGDLIAAIDAKISQDGLTAVIGPGARAAQLAARRSRALLRAEGLPGNGSPFATRIMGSSIKLTEANKHDLFQFFKGFWHEFGTKGNPKKNIPPLPATPFMGPAYDLNANWIKGNVRKAIANALRRAAAGGGGTNG